MRDGTDRDDVLVQLRKQLAQRFDIEHITLQLENEALELRLEDCLPENCYEPAEVGRSERQQQNE